MIWCVVVFKLFISLNTRAATMRCTSVKSKPKKRPAENTLYQQRIDEVSRSLRNLCTNPQNKAYFDKTPCLPAGMKRAYLEDNSYPTEVQRIVAARVFKEIVGAEGRTRTGTPFTASGPKPGASTNFATPAWFRSLNKHIRNQGSWFLERTLYLVLRTFA